MASTYLDLRSITCCEAARLGDDKQACHCLLQRLALARCAIIGISFPPIPWTVTQGDAVEEKDGVLDMEEGVGVAEMENEWQGDAGEEKDGVLNMEEGVAEEGVAENED